MVENSWVLVIEDDALHLVAVTSLLKELRVHYKRNTTGLNVALQARAMQPPPTAILLDLDLPYENSVKICRMIRSDSALKHIPVIAMGGGEWLSRRMSLQKYGFNGFLKKPLARQAFKHLMQDVLAGKVGWLDDAQSSSMTS